ncbi:hypothetical protein PILCRDRAFT_79756 [Piloderma croceum F 1598]|uniref:Fungal-type protein kinase domain-containing protein n=1 Tax=Piloderma croceum (strain F 1598) TaxID=765440 RepID=A0A0C3EQA9_PILCF|nr:hypothetical protein PILCRDRAFT_79756 [Piloderma croceum F 1598]
MFLRREGLGLAEDAILVKLTVPTPNSNWEYIVPVPTAGPYTPPGQATCGFVGYDLQRHVKVFIKDTWRVDLPDIEKEGDTYQLMQVAQVKNIALCFAAGDIEYHTTLTHLYQDELWACKTKKVLVPHHHYRLVLDVIGDHLTNFSSLWEMLRCVLDPLESHEDALKAGVLHCDISVGNILIVDRRGILIDWDLSKRLVRKPCLSDAVRQPTRTGTWQFMSAALVKSKEAPHTFVDDLESIFYVILWLLVMYLANSMSPASRTSFIQSVLDPEQFEGTGGSAKADFLQGCSTLREVMFNN